MRGTDVLTPIAGSCQALRVCPLSTRGQTPSEGKVYFPATKEKAESEGGHPNLGGQAHGVPSSVQAAEDPRGATQSQVVTQRPLLAPLLVEMSQQCPAWGR